MRIFFSLPLTRNEWEDVEGLVEDGKGTKSSSSLAKSMKGEGGGEDEEEGGADEENEREDGEGLL